jgi:hypothetical protein
VSVRDQFKSALAPIIDLDAGPLGRPFVPNEKKVTTPTKAHFNPRTFLSTIGKGREMVSFGKKSTIFAQGDTTDGLFFIQEGKVQLSVVSEAGREATLGILSEGDFFGEGGLAGQLSRMSCAIALTDCVLLHVEHAAKIVGHVHEVPVETQHSIPGRLGRSTFQLQRKTACTSSSVDGALRQGRRFRNVRPKAQSRNAGRDGRDHALARVFLHEPIQEAGLHQLRRRQ